MVRWVSAALILGVAMAASPAWSSDFTLEWQMQRQTWAQEDMARAGDAAAAALRRTANAAERAATSAERQADAMERIANGGKTNAEIAYEQRVEAEQAAWRAARIRQNAPQIIAIRTKWVQQVTQDRFVEWYLRQNTADLAAFFHLTRRQKYTNELTKQQFEIEPDQDFDVRVRAAARAYFDRVLLPADSLYRSQKDYLLAVSTSVQAGRLPPELSLAGPPGSPPENHDHWVNIQYHFPGVKVYELWTAAVAYSEKSLGPAVGDSEIQELANRVFHKWAADLLILKPPSVNANAAARPSAEATVQTLRADDLEDVSMEQLRAEQAERLK